MNGILPDTDPFPTIPTQRTVERPTPRDTCPWWCQDEHTGAQDVDSDGSVLVVHRQEIPAGHYRVQVRSGVFIEPDGTITPSSTEVVLDADGMTVEDAHALRAALGLAAEIAGGAR